MITQTNNEDNPLMHGVVEHKCIPVIGIDLWEHAYLTDYLGDKAQYCDNYLDSVDWAVVSQNFEQFNLQNKPAPMGAWNGIMRERLNLIIIIKTKLFYYSDHDNS